jgi:hypothetical protein
MLGWTCVYMIMRYIHGMNAKIVIALKTCAAAALAALLPMIPALVDGLPEGSGAVVSALVGAVLLHVRAPEVAK